MVLHLDIVLVTVLQVDQKVYLLMLHHITLWVDVKWLLVVAVAVDPKSYTNVVKTLVMDLTLCLVDLL
ncbi:MAG: hypothetical protein CBE16_12520 [Rhodospirillaceae bacterium TMED256]|nr:MAG: hypothetical protein CBE16_12520 [Rhodospirillaceae bacterium TMED256]